MIRRTHRAPNAAPIVIALAFAFVAGTAGCARSGAYATKMTASRTDAESSFAGRTAAGNVDHGATLFAADCATCHGSGGRSGGNGPSLVDERERMDLAHTIDAVVNPYPGMPGRYPVPLTTSDVADVAAFVETIR